MASELRILDRIVHDLIDGVTTSYDKETGLTISKLRHVIVNPVFSLKNHIIGGLQYTTAIHTGKYEIDTLGNGTVTKNIEDAFLFIKEWIETPPYEPTQEELDDPYERLLRL